MALLEDTAVFRGTPQELFGGLIEVILDCKDTVFTKDGFIDEKDTSIPHKTSYLINDLLRWKKKCEEDKIFIFPDHINSEDRNYTSCDWLIKGIKCFVHATYRGELSLLKWIKNVVKDEYFFWIKDLDPLYKDSSYIEDSKSNLVKIIGLSQEAIPVVKWIKNEDYKLFLEIKNKFEQNPLMTYEMLCVVFELKEESKEEIVHRRKRFEELRRDWDADAEYMRNDPEYNSIAEEWPYHEGWPYHLDIPVKYFIDSGNLDQLVKYFDRFVRIPRDIEELLDIIRGEENDDDNLLLSYLLLSCTDEVFYFLVSKLSLQHNYTPRKHSFDLKRTSKFYSKINDANVCESGGHSVWIKEFEEADLLTLFDAFKDTQFDTAIGTFTCKFKFGNNVAKCLIKNRLDALETNVLRDDLPYEIDIYEFWKRFDFCLDAESMVTMYEAICA